MEMQPLASFLCCVLLLQFSIGSHALEIYEKTMRNDPENVVKRKEHHDNLYLSVFFKVNDLHIGKRMPIYFARNDDPNRTHLLSREEADSIPFSSQKLPYLLDFFSVSKNSPQAKAMKTTLTLCELKPREDEYKSCVTSLESLMDMTRGFFGTVKPNLLTTKIISSNHTIFQWYTFVEKPVEIHVSKVVACHTKAYPYLVYYCHGDKDNFTRVFKVALRGDQNGERVEAIATCHMDTSKWDPNNVVFEVLGEQLGSPVCHFLPADNLVWVASS
ncbi:putative BURP domain-containing protein [Helianthus annuus]|uniref:BURP domain-containing protein n=1 Tax=Helianthus annuus TaxID=4232 RepID=A0A251U3B5_HELAN|nr:BURP domain protein USPL1 [Helianthus annuus]KAF5814347.1 putative BURP domain-containing protein [Helianthus annuus]KAJ0943595.1 putative BURP domain-containing protein [Helianthus annuus]